MSLHSGLPGCLSVSLLRGEGRSQIGLPSCGTVQKAAVRLLIRNGQYFPTELVMVEVVWPENMYHASCLSVYHKIHEHNCVGIQCCQLR